MNDNCNSDDAGGIGRGNGEGSRATRFKRGGPSGNPNGRPRKVINASDTDISAAFQRRLRQRVTVTIDGKKAKMPRIDAMVEVVLATFQDMEPRDQRGLLRQIHAMPAIASDMAPRDLPMNAIAEFVEGLAALAAEDEADRAALALPAFR